MANDFPPYTDTHGNFRTRRMRPLRVAARLYGRRMRAYHRCPPRQRASRIAWSGIGAFCGILAVSLLANAPWTIGHIFLIGSFGASAVLLYGAPLADFSQPRNLVGGHIISAIVGVSVMATIGRWAPSLILWGIVPALAVSLAVVAMHLTRTIHPPGGATALIAVIGGDHVSVLGFWYVLFPITAGALAMLLIAVLINNMSTNSHGHYPRYWFR